MFCVLLRGVCNLVGVKLVLFCVLVFEFWFRGLWLTLLGC